MVQKHLSLAPWVRIFVRKKVRIFFKHKRSAFILNTNGPHFFKHRVRIFFKQKQMFKKNADLFK